MYLRLSSTVVAFATVLWRYIQGDKVYTDSNTCIVKLKNYINVVTFSKAIREYMHEADPSNGCKRNS